MMRPFLLRRRPAQYPCEASNGRPNSTNFSVTNRFKRLPSRHSTLELTTLPRGPFISVIGQCMAISPRPIDDGLAQPRFRLSADEPFEASPMSLLSCICSDICYTITLLLCCPTPHTRLYPAAFRSCRSLVGTGTTMDHHICQGHTRPGSNLHGLLLPVLERSHRATKSSIPLSIEKNKF